MIAPLAKFIDWSVLQIAYAMLPQSMWQEAANERDLVTGASGPISQRPDFIGAEKPAGTTRLWSRRTRAGASAFPTPRPCEVQGEQHRLWPAINKRRTPGSESVGHLVLLHENGGDFPGHQFGISLVSPAAAIERIQCGDPGIYLTTFNAVRSAPVWSIGASWPPV
jgi:hypothetical protein